MWRVVLVLVCFWPARWTAAASEHRRRSDFFYGTDGQPTERTWRDVLSGQNSAFITVLLLETLRWGRRNKKNFKKDLARFAPAPGTERDAAVRDSRDGCKFSHRVRKKTSFLFIFYFIFWKRVHTCLYYLSLPVCFTLLDCSR